MLIEMPKNKISEDNNFLLYHRDTRIDKWELLTAEILDLQTLKKYAITTEPSLNSNAVNLRLVYVTKRIDNVAIQSVLIDRKELTNFLSEKILKQVIVNTEKTQILFYGSINNKLTQLPYEKILSDGKEWEKVILNGKTILNNNDELIVHR
jgi:hypothetical protein